MSEISPAQIKDLQDMAKKVVFHSQSARSSRFDSDELAQVLVVESWRYLASGKYASYVEKCNAMDEDPISEPHMCYRRMVFSLKTYLSDARQFVVSVPMQIKRQIAYNPQSIALKAADLEGDSLEELVRGTNQPLGSFIAAKDSSENDIDLTRVSQTIVELLHTAIDNEAMDAEQTRLWWTSALESGGVMEDCPRLLCALGKVSAMELQILTFHVLWQFPKHVTEQIMGINSRDVTEITNEAKEHLAEALANVPPVIEPTDYPKPHSVVTHTRLMQYTLFGSAMVDEVVAAVDRFYNELLASQTEVDSEIQADAMSM